jgi:hypothetical protein
MNDRLTTNDLMSVALVEHRLRDLVQSVLSVAELHDKVKVFEAVVWFPRLQAVVNGTRHRGMQGTCRDIKVMTWCCAGRCLIQLERNSHRITLITADDEKPWNRDNCHVAPGMGPMGIQSIDAEWLEAMRMLYEATRYGDQIVLKPDDEVSIG